MKKLIVLFLVCSYLSSNAQSDIDLQKAVNEYSAKVYKNFTGGTDEFKTLITNFLQQQGYDGQLAISNGMERINKDRAFREATYRFWNIVSHDTRTLSSQLTVIGMTIPNAEIMAAYITKFNDTSGMLLANNYGEEPAPEDVPIAISRFTNLVLPANDGEQTGKIVIRFFLNKEGQVTDAIPGAKGSTLGGKDLWQKCKEAMMKSRFIQSDTAIQSGVVVFKFKSKQ